MCEGSLRAQASFRFLHHQGINLKSRKSTQRKRPPQRFLSEIVVLKTPVLLSSGVMNYDDNITTSQCGSMKGRKGEREEGIAQKF